MVLFFKWLIYFNASYDLAILSFESEENLDINLLKIAQTEPQCGEDVFCISSPSFDNRNIITYGKLLSANDTTIKFNDGNISGVFKHSAYIDEGSSGSIVLNTSNEIVGINIGGGTDVLGNFKYGIAISLNQLTAFIEEWV